jgi:hypothetical protein
MLLGGLGVGFGGGRTAGQPRRPVRVGSPV